MDRLKQLETINWILLTGLLVCLAVGLGYWLHPDTKTEFVSSMLCLGGNINYDKNENGENRMICNDFLKISVLTEQKKCKEEGGEFIISDSFRAGLEEYPAIIKCIKPTVVLFDYPIIK